MVDCRGKVTKNKFHFKQIPIIIHNIMIYYKLLWQFVSTFSLIFRTFAPIK